MILLLLFLDKFLKLNVSPLTLFSLIVYWDRYYIMINKLTTDILKRAQIGRQSEKKSEGKIQVAWNGDRGSIQDYSSAQKESSINKDNAYSTPIYIVNHVQTNAITQKKSWKTLIWNLI